MTVEAARKVEDVQKVHGAPPIVVSGQPLVPAEQPFSWPFLA